MNIKIVTAFILVAFCHFLEGFSDLDAKKQKFVLETKKINIPNYPDAFNPSIVRWKNSILMSFRIRDPLTKQANDIGLIWLDEKFNPIGRASVLVFNCEGPYPRIQEPRLITLDSELYVVFSANPNKSDEKNCRMFAAHVNFDGTNFSISECEALLNYKVENKPEEKNWVPFDYHGNLLFAYSINPHLILRPLFGTTTCETWALSKGLIKWKWGELRGGSPAQLENGEYLAFFHSSINVATIQSEGKKMQHYFMGAYTFSAEPPFGLTRISPDPIVAKKFYNGPTYETWKPLRVIYPGGFITSEDYIWVSYGRQDHESWIVKFDKKELLKSLLPVVPVK